MSFQVGSICYPSGAAAAAAAASSQVGQIVQLGSTAYVVDVTGVTSTSITYLLSDLSSSSTLTRVAPFTPLECGLLDASDALSIGWGVLAAWIATAAVMYLRKVFA